MKRIIILLVSFLFVIAGYGQTVYSLRNTTDRKLDIKDNETYWFRAKPAPDTINEPDIVWAYTFGVDNLYDQNKQFIKIVLDSVSGTPLTTVAWSGKVFWDDAAWTEITTASWSGTTGDTTLLLDQSTAKHFRFYKLSHDGDGAGTFKYAITKQQVQFYK